VGQTVAVPGNVIWGAKARLWRAQQRELIMGIWCPQRDPGAEPMGRGKGLWSWKGLSFGRPRKWQIC